MKSSAENGPVEPDLHRADLLARGGQVFDRFLSRLGAGSHEHDYAFRIRRADVIEQVVLPSRRS